VKKLLHLSDLHFGRVNNSLVQPLLAIARELAPDLVVISGDFTQRARRAQFRAAAAFLESLPKPRLVVPGNHDIPLWDAVRRFVRPLGRYRRYITRDLAPFYHDDEIAVLGINTARSLTREFGRINEEQIRHAGDVFARLKPGVVKVVVTHHPFDLPPGSHNRLVGRSAMAMRGLAAAGVDLILSGHLHLQRTTLSAQRYHIEGHSALVAQAGTTISTRGRGEANSFNFIHASREQIRIDHYLWHLDAARFIPGTSESFSWSGKEWRRLSPNE
jgi:3',5'-cyclic AMP phosphodiesterase CpdA